MKKTVTVVISIIVLAWLILFFSGKGILIHSSGPTKNDNGLVSTMSCNYFSGTGIFKKEFVYSDDSIIGGFVGRSACPRTQSI